ncbi:ferlin [Anaerosphaera multitolerans]|uniref:Ferlin n=1 Tax=Anaerosphaera multitolerans TaxID=2487351 RepID=A0A437S4E9_9FIRM|nr:ferlin [Anaerosphaera multitolerans]RVU53915.1 ferlin [Anaerosphaera multitolerans]
MKKKIFLVSLLSVTLLLSGCGNKNKENSVKPSTDNTNTKTELNTPTDKDEDTDDKTPNNSNENSTISTGTSQNREVIKNLIDNSDYISRIKIQITQDNSTSIKFIEDYKGDLSSIELELPKTLKANKEYIIFYVDGAKGQISPTRDSDSFIEIQGENDASLEYVESIFKTEETPRVLSETGQKK